MLSERMLRIGRITAGTVCLVLGVLGLFLPFLQGVLFLVIGLTLLSKDSDRAKRTLDWLRAHLHRRKRAQAAAQEGAEDAR